MQKLDEMPRIFEQLFEGLNPPPIGQRDNTRYTEVGAEESQNYEKTNYETPSEEDIWIFAEEINILRHAKALGGKPMDRHIDVATGPNFYPLLASLPYFKELFAVEFAPGNIVNECRMLGLDVETRKPLDNPEPLPRHWKQWMRVAAVLYNADGATGLQEMKDNDPEGYQKLLSFLSGEMAGIMDDPHPNPANDAEREANYSAFLEKVNGLDIDGLQFIDREESNPYLTYIRNDNLQAALQEKVTVKRGDILNAIEGDSDEEYAAKKAEDPSYIRLENLTGLQGTADYLTEHFASESVSADPRVVAHFKTNSIQLAKQGALYTTVHMGGTTGYETFNRSADERPLEELCATPGFFKALLTPVMRPLSYGRRGDLINVEINARVRSGYDNMVLISGTANHMTTKQSPDGQGKRAQPKFANGTELIHSLCSEHSWDIDGNKLFRVDTSKGIRPVFCAQEDISKTLTRELVRNKSRRAGEEQTKPLWYEGITKEELKRRDEASYARTTPSIYEPKQIGIPPAYWDQFYENEHITPTIKGRTTQYRENVAERRTAILARLRSERLPRSLLQERFEQQCSSELKFPWVQPQRGQGRGA